MYLLYLLSNYTFKIIQFKISPQRQVRHNDDYLMHSNKIMLLVNWIILIVQTVFYSLNIVSSKFPRPLCGEEVMFATTAVP